MRLKQNNIQIIKFFCQIYTYGKFFLLLNQNRACSKMKSAQWGFSFKKGSMSITHVFSRIVTYKKHKKRKMFSPHRNHVIHYYFSKLCLQHTK